VQVVDVKDARGVVDVLANLCEVDALGSGFQEDTHSLAEQRPRAGQDHQTDGGGRDGVGLGEACETDDDGGDDDGHRSQQVAQDFEVGAAHVQ